MSACAVVAVSSSCNVTPEWHGVHRSSSKTENVAIQIHFFLSCFHVFVLHQYGLVAQKLGFHFHVHCLLHVFIFHRLAPEEYLSEHFSPCTSIYITVPWKWKWKYFQLMYLFKGQMKFLSQIESPIVRYVQQNLLPQVLFSHK